MSVLLKCDYSDGPHWEFFPKCICFLFFVFIFQEEKKEEIEKKKKEKERKEGRKGERREGRNLLHLSEPVINRATNTD